MEFNPDPTKQVIEVLFSCKRSKPPPHPPLILKGNVVQNYSGHKHLGHVLDKCFSFARHINENIIKAKKEDSNCPEKMIIEFLLKFGNVSKIMTNDEKMSSKALFVIILFKF